MLTLQLVMVLSACRYYLLFQNKGVGERAVATQQWTAGLATEEAMAVEGRTRALLSAHSIT